MIPRPYELLPSSTKFSNLLVFNSLLQILIFSDPYDFFGLALWSPLPREGTKKNCLWPCFWSIAFQTLGPRGFLFGGFAFRGLGLFGAPRCLDSALKQETKNRFGLSYLGPRFLNFEALAFSGGLGLFRAPHWCTVWVSH
jgi:hypothetical protein